MSETKDDTPTEEELEAKYSDIPSEEYSITLTVPSEDDPDKKMKREYELNEEFRASIEQRAMIAFEENEYFSCWWRVADADDEEDEDTNHQEGDPILVIETTGPFTSWENLDQLELEQDTDAFDSFGGVDNSGTDVDEGNGMKTIKPGEVGESDEREVPRLHFGVSPQSFEELPSAEPEQEDRVPPMAQHFGEEPEMFVFAPEHPEVDEVWDAGRATVPMDSWIEWNVQRRALQPKLYEDGDLQLRYESMLRNRECELLSEEEVEQSSTQPQGKSGSAERKGDEFEKGKFGGNNWNV